MHEKTYKQASYRIGMAEAGEGLWFNPVSGEQETVNGVYCSCYDCKIDAEICGGYTRWRGSMFFTKHEFREHQKERRAAYFARKSESDKLVRTKLRTRETGAGRSTSGIVGRTVPTYFDIKHGKWMHTEDPVHEFERIFGY